MHPPVPFTLRGAHGQGTAEAVGVATTPTDDDLRVFFNLGHIGRDKKTWTNPDEFRPERFLPGGEAEHVGPTPSHKEIRMMPFGAGHRQCPGVGVGMMLIKCFLASLVREFDWAPSAEHRSGDIDMTELDGFLKMMKTPLSARVMRRGG
jgi:cytochrome P450